MKGFAAMLKDGTTAQAEAYQTTFNDDRQTLPITYKDWEKRVKEMLDHGPFDYVESGAGTEDTL